MRLLVTEDEERLALLLKRGFEEEGYAVDVCGDGAEALWLATEIDYDAIVLDIMLPGMDGVSLTRRLRETDRWSPILLLTARDAVTDRVAGLDAGADDYLVKPFSFAELVARVRALARRRTAERPVVIQVGDLRLDPVRRRAWRGRAELVLLPREFALLRLLLSHPGEVLTRTRILEHVWDFAYEPESNVVDQCVAAIRRKVDRPFDRCDIETVRGVGYRLREPEDA